MLKEKGKTARAAGKPQIFQAQNKSLNCTRWMLVQILSVIVNFHKQLQFAGMLVMIGLL